MSIRSVPVEIAGRPCPYCHSPLERGTNGTECDACAAFHHTDCWQDAGGCSTFGCVNAPSDAEAGAAGARAGRTWSRRLAIAALVALGLILVAGGTLAIIAVLSGDSPVAEEEGKGSSSTPSETSTVATTTPRPKPPPAFDTSSAPAFIRSYYSLLNDGRFAKAWEALSTSERAEAGGYSAWKAGYANTDFTRVQEVGGTEGEGGLTSISFSINSSSTCGGGTYEQSFSGYWTIDLATPEIVSATFEQTDGEALPDGC